MCWSVEVSLIAAVYGYAVSFVLYKRKRSARDPWYALFLSTFTTTQLFDALFWYIKGPDADLPCADLSGFMVGHGAPFWGAVNLFVSRYVLPPVIFFQPIVLSIFPSPALKKLRPAYRVLVAAASLLPVVFGTCTKVWTGPMPVSLPTLLYDGILPPLWLMFAGIALWSMGAMAFVRPARCWMGILLVGGVNLVILQLLDGTIRLVSKLCFWCLLLSILWLLEPLWLPSAEGDKAALSSARKQPQADVAAAGLKVPLVTVAGAADDADGASEGEGGPVFKN